jgi:hypothetical protein
LNVDDYIDSLPEDRRIAIRCVRELVNSRLPPGYEEGMMYGQIAWFVPFTRLAETYNDQPLALAALGSQRNHMAIYLMSVYGDEALRTWFEAAYKKTGKKLDMGKSCVRFKSLDALALDVVGDAISKVPVDEYVASYERLQAKSAKPKPVAKPAKKAAPPAKKAAKPAKKAAPPAKKAAKSAKKSAKPKPAKRR